jgi:hypothetical protein
VNENTMPICRSLAMKEVFSGPAAFAMPCSLVPA